MQRYFLACFALAVLLVFATSSFALEKTATRATDLDRPNGWNAGSTCSVVYYNFCTGWVWIWSGWSSGDCVGVCFENCCPGPGAVLDSNWMYVWTAAPSGYGFTGTIEVLQTGPDCSVCDAPSLGSQTYLPLSGWNQYVWGIPVPQRFLIRACHGISPFPNPIAYATDHPAAGPTGPVACGTCYPTTRANHSFFLGTAASPLCPGSPLNDGVCDAQFLWDAALLCGPISVEEASWGKIKSLYR